MTGHGYGHVRLGLAAKMHRPEIELVRHRLRKFRVPGEVDPGADCVERHTRYTQLLTTIGIELSEFGNRRDLSEQTLSVDPSPGDRFGRPR